MTLRRRTVLQWGLGTVAAAATRSFAQDKYKPMFPVEKDAQLRLLRWSGFVKTDGFLKLAKALEEKNHPVGFALGHAVGDANNWLHWCLWAHGGKTVEADDKTIAINKQESWNALEYAKELYSVMVPGTGSWLDPNNNRAFLAGEVSVTNNGISIYFAAKKDFLQIAADMDHAN